MKICILSIVNIKHMSLISLYTSYLDEMNIEYDIIYIDKYNEKEITTAKNIYRYQIKINRRWSKLHKFLVYLRFKKYAQNIMEENQYDLIIVWRTETALMFSKYLSSKMRGKYCVNVRDYCYEKKNIIFHIVKKVIEKSLFTTISSDGYKKFLPKNNYISVHSYNEKLLAGCSPKRVLKKINEPIHICFIGYVRFFNIDKKLIDTLKNDERYILQFFGEGSQYLQEYVKENNIKNVEFKNGFKVEETCKLLERADVINNLYGYDDIALDTAISTKYYYSLYLNIPILVFEGTYMEEISRKSGNGFVVKKDFDSFADDFYDWYHSLQYEEFKTKCMEEIDRIKGINADFYKLLSDIIPNEGRNKGESKIKYF